MKPTWQSDDGSVQLYHGDCLDVLPHLSKVDAVVTDPPYGMSFVSNFRGVQRFAGIANDEFPFVEWLPSTVKLINDAGSLICFHRWDSAEIFKVAIEETGLKIKSQIVWSKGGGGIGDLEASFSPAHELAWFAIKDGFKFKNGRPGTSVIQAARVTDMKHPMEKPVKLMIYLVRHLTRKNDVVLDLFMGSAPVGVACVKLNRKYIGIELDDVYFEESKRRIIAEVKQVKMSFGLARYDEKCPKSVGFGLPITKKRKG